MHPFIHLINAMTLFTVLQGLENQFLIILKGLHRLQSGKTIKDLILAALVQETLIDLNKDRPMFNLLIGKELLRGGFFVTILTMMLI